MYLCSLCNKVINGKKTSNLAAHIQRHHAEVYMQMGNDESIEEKRLKLLLDCVGELVLILAAFMIRGCCQCWKKP